MLDPLSIIYLFSLYMSVLLEQISYVWNKSKTIACKYLRCINWGKFILTIYPKYHWNEQFVFLSFVIANTFLIPHYPHYEQWKIVLTQ